ncbi:phosphoenolpyruvate--protein phosphotransferase [Photobacterium minamisatsumaniensis]|uniref:phosphoenolpyruvate--protein phosphotransferase n=1 Tax=Photobacterium minamisatsumaniensis TaxID=2910233 RepID=UPI003D0B8DBA
MTKQFEFKNVLVNGIHARPAAEIESRAQAFQCQISLVNSTKGTRANAKSVLSLVGTDSVLGDVCQFVFDGEDEIAAFEHMKHFIEHDFEHCDETVAVIENNDDQPLPVSLVMASPKFVRGSVVSRGIGQGKPVSCSQVDLYQLADKAELQQSEVITESLLTGLAKLQQQLADALAILSENAKEEQAILQAHRQIACDSIFRDALLNQASQPNSLRAIADAASELKAPLLNSESSYLRERALDIEDLCVQLAGIVVGKPLKNPVALISDSIVIAENLTPSELLAFDKSHLKGIVLAHAGQTSHTVILARSFGIPVLTGIDNLQPFIQGAEWTILDAQHGCLIRDPNDAVAHFYDLEGRKIAAKEKELAPFVTSKGMAKDGRPMALYANIAVGLEAEAAFTQGAEGIGLFRTEMLFMDSPNAPTEQEQYEIYCEVVNAANGKQVIIRTLDIGGDKPLPYLDLPQEENPFLGYRAIRMYPQHQAMIESQIRALLRATQTGAIDIMIPMVSCVEEVKWVHQLCHQCAKQLAAEGYQLGQWRLGIMVEVPSTLYMLEKISNWVDFVSIGSNDLTQYFMACDRGNKHIKSLYDSLNPSFITFLRDLAVTAKRAGLELGICGEMAGDIQALPLLLAMGFEEISVSSPNIALLRAHLSRLDSRDCEKLLTTVISKETACEVKACIDMFWQQQNQPDILDERLIIQCSAKNKADVIKLLTDNLEVQGRVKRGDDAERAIWEREAIFATSLGFGVAVPHCKSEHVTHNSISVAHLAEPIVWNEKENEQVLTVIMLTISNNDNDGTHMNIFSKLARKLMHSDFRQQLMQTCPVQAKTAEQTTALLKGCLFEQVA